MTQPIIHDYLTQIFQKHYRLGPDKADEEAERFGEILELYGLELIIGDWIVPETKVIRMDAFDILRETAKETMEREPWLAREIQ